MDVDGATTLCTFQVWHLVRLHGIRAFPRDSRRILIQTCDDRKTYIAVYVDVVELQNGLRISTLVHMALYRGLLARPSRKMSGALSSAVCWSVYWEVARGAG